MEEEVFINGFCRSQNQGRMVVAVYEQKANSWQLQEADCGYEHCKFRDACDIARQIRQGPA